MTHKHYVCTTNDLMVKATSRSGAWQLMRNECHKRGQEVPTFDKIREVVPMYLWEIFSRILSPEITGSQASEIYEQAYRLLPEFTQWAMETHKCGEKEASQLHKECERTRDEA